MTNLQLYLNIFYFAFPEGFVERLMKEQNWNKTFALKAIEEYKKFLYLMAIAKEEISPSLIIDEVWHLHLLYTKSYWHKMCRDIIKREIHHGPGTGKKSHDVKYVDLYLKTKQKYKTEFGHFPNEIWEAKNMNWFKRILLTLTATSIFGFSGGLLFVIILVAVLLIIYLIYRLIKKSRYSGSCSGSSGSDGGFFFGGGGSSCSSNSDSGFGGGDFGGGGSSGSSCGSSCGGSCGGGD